LNNSAGRLLYWLELGDQRQKQQSAMAEWCAVFGLDSSVPADRAECTRRGTMLAGLARSVRREAEQLDEVFHPAVMLEHFHEVESALDQFTILPSIGLEQMYAQMKGTAWQSLRMLDAIFSTQSSEPIVEPDTIRDHIQKVRDLIDLIIADDELDAALKRYVVSRLRDVESTLTDGLITGAPGVELAVNSLLGAAHRDRDLWDRVAHTKWGPRIGAAWMALVTTLGGVGAVPVLMPGEERQPPAIHNTVEVDVDLTVHDAALIEESGDGDAAAASR